MEDNADAIIEEPGAKEPQTAEPTESLRKLQTERDDLYDRLLRKQAEFENFRRRSEKERAEHAQFALADLMKELLNVLDSFELAIRNASAAENEALLKGFELIHKQFQDTLARFGLKAIDAKGAPFDPNFHRAVTTMDAAGVDENTVIEELRKGYLLNGRLLRESWVAVKGDEGAKG
ncbi:MAG TPA: nucleotide exchange factor GrpE [Terriglobia bacterium]|nr:nucleotide exchange factor GrpE [Terriglobia bacterium]